MNPLEAFTQDPLGALSNPMGALQNLTSATGAAIVVDTALGSFTIDPSSLQSTPGDAQGQNGGGSLAVTILRLLDVKVSLRIAGTVFGPAPVSP